MVTSSIPKTPANMRIAMLWAICLYLALEGVPFVVVKLIANVSVGELFGPYLAFAVPGVIFLLLAMSLRRWEERGPPPRRLALGWGLSIVFFFLAICGACFYASVTLRFVHRDDAVWVFGMMAVAGTPVGFFMMYNMVLQRIASRAAKADESGV